jgi:DNA-binding response OmpR family regulator
LLADDEQTVRKFVAAVLRAAGYSVVPTATAAEALAVARTQLVRINLLVTDVDLPDGYGPELAEAVAAIHPGVDVLVISGWPYEAVVDRGLAPGTSYLGKPFTVEELRAAVRSALGKVRE